MSTKLINESALLAFSENDTEMIGSLAEIFAGALPDYLPRLKAAIDNADSLELRESAHQLKSQFRYFFCDELIHAAQRLEDCGRDGKEPPGGSYSELVDGIRKLLTELNVIAGLKLGLPGETA